MKSTVFIAIAVMLASAGVVFAAPVTMHAPRHHAHSGMHPAISADSATAIARTQVPGATLKSHELEREKGRLIYSFDFQVPGKSGIDEVNIDAMTGMVIAVEHETPRSERREKQQEKHAAAASPRATH